MKATTKSSHPENVCRNPSAAAGLTSSDARPVPATRAAFAMMAIGTAASAMRNRRLIRRLIVGQPEERSRASHRVVLALGKAVGLQVTRTLPAGRGVTPALTSPDRRRAASAGWWRTRGDGRRGSDRTRRWYTAPGHRRWTAPNTITPTLAMDTGTMRGDRIERCGIDGKNLARVSVAVGHSLIVAPI